MSTGHDQETAGGGAPPSYDSLADTDNAPPAYLNNSTPDDASAPPAENNISYPNLQQQPQNIQMVSVAQSGQSSGMSMTEMLSNPNAVQVMPAQGQPVIYMMQQPDGSLVQLQGVQAVQGQPMMFQASGVGVGDPAVTSGGNNGQSVQTIGGATVIVNNGGEGAMGTNMVERNGQLQAQANAAGPVRPNGFVLEQHYNTKAFSWGLLLSWIIYVMQIYGSAANILTRYDGDSVTITFGYNKAITTDDDYYWYTTDTTYYSDGCDDGSDDYCDLETRGDTFEAFSTISNLVGLVAVVCLSNIMAKCCCNDEKSVAGQLTAVKICVLITLICNIIAVMTWQTGNPIYDTYDDATWGVSTWMFFVSIFGYLIVFGCVFRKKQPVVPGA